MDEHNPNTFLPAPPAIEKNTDQIVALTGRLRMNEERSAEARKKMIVIEQNMLNNHKRAMSEIKTLQSEVSELKRTMHEIEDRMIMIIKELRMTARKEDIDITKKYVELWNPVRFVTRDQVERIVDEKVKAESNNE